MRRYKQLGHLALFGMISWGIYGVVQQVNKLMLPESPEEVAAVRAQVEAQNESACYRPARKSAEHQNANLLNNVYFGDLHIHTEESGDAYLFGNRLDMDAAYRIAKGESATIGTGERVELTRPLDFAALT